MIRITMPLAVMSIALASLQVVAAPPSELQQYVQQCQTELHFNASDVKAMNCNDGSHFAGSGLGPINDFLLYQKINDTVDLATACRWIDHNDSISAYNGTRAASIELIIHNRQNGETCFFQAKDTIDVSNCQINDIGCASRAVSTAIVSPTNFNPFHSSANPNADDFWQSPTEINNKLMFSDQNMAGTPTVKEPVRCIGCHSQGPYIASTDIVYHLARFGLLNDRHDTYARMSSTSYHYHVVGSASGPPYNNFPVLAAFQNWDNLIAQYNVAAGSESCATCHAFASKSKLGSLFSAGDLFFPLLPSISSDIDELESAVPSFSMPPYDEGNHFRWINLDTPVDGVETETFVDAMNAANTLVPTLLENCAAPGNLEAHAVGVPIEQGFSTQTMAQLPDRLRTFNLKEGLVCLNADQENGKKCNNYAVKYICSDNGTSLTTSILYDHPLAADGDHEERSKISGNICSGGINPIAIEATVNGNTFKGPSDRLARLSPYGLTCNNSDQIDKQCSSYVVRYSSCGTAPTAISRTLTNANVPASGSKQLTAAINSQVKAQGHNGSWNTQLWVLDPVPNTEYVRLKNTSNNVTVYVNVQADGTTVGTAPFNSTATSEMWIIEPVSGSSTVRLKNVLSGKYLTMADPNSYPNSPNYLPIFSQGLNVGWNTQRWIIQ